MWYVSVKVSSHLPPPYFCPSLSHTLLGLHFRHPDFLSVAASKSSSFWRCGSMHLSFYAHLLYIRSVVLLLFPNGGGAAATASITPSLSPPHPKVDETPRPPTPPTDSSSPRSSPLLLFLPPPPQTRLPPLACWPCCLTVET